jgi:predicted nucleic acid-binding Zn ribbon protein
LEGIAKFLPAAVRQQLFRSDPSLLELLRALWPKMVGHGIAQQCRPVEFVAGTLTIVTACPTWAVQFRQLNAEIRRNINTILGGEHVRKLRVRVDPAFEPPPLAPGTVSQPSRPHGTVSKGTPKDRSDPMEILRQSFDKYFARSNRRGD